MGGISLVLHDESMLEIKGAHTLRVAWGPRVPGTKCISGLRPYCSRKGSLLNTNWTLRTAELYPGAFGSSLSITNWGIPAWQRQTKPDRAPTPMIGTDNEGFFV